MASTKISDIEGIGPKYAQKLQKSGIRTVNALLNAGATPKGRSQIAEKTGIDGTYILKWVNMADLYRIKGIGSEYSELLEKAGVDTVKELKNRKPENLYQKITELHSSGTKIVRQLPGLKRIKSWIDQAKKRPPAIKY